MTTQLNYRTATDDRPVTATAPTRTIEPPRPAEPPDEPRRRGWLLPAGVAVGAAVLGVGIVVIDAITESSATTTEQTDHGVSQRLVDDSIGQAVAERTATDRARAAETARLDAQALAEQTVTRARAAETARLNAQVPAPRVVPSSADAAERRAASTTSSQQLVQDAIDQALADVVTGNRPVSVPRSAQGAERWAQSTDVTSSQQLVQDSIDRALADVAAGDR